jgi:hypothetical protein
LTTNTFSFSTYFLSLPPAIPLFTVTSARILASLFSQRLVLCVPCMVTREFLVFLRNFDTYMYGTVNIKNYIKAGVKEVVEEKDFQSFESMISSGFSPNKL